MQEILAAWNAKEMAPVGHLDHMKSCQIDVQFISPRPFQMMHSEKPAKIVHWLTRVTNNIIHRSCQLMPGKFYRHWRAAPDRWASRSRPRSRSWSAA